MINIKQFYIIAGILMLVSSIGQVYNLYLIWAGITIGAKVSTIFGGILFSLLLAVFFLGLWYKTPTTPDALINNAELDKLLQDIQKGNIEEEKEVISNESSNLCESK